MNLRKAELKELKEVKEIADLLRLNIPGFVWNDEDFIAKQIERG